LGGAGVGGGAGGGWGGQVGWWGEGVGWGDDICQVRWGLFFVFRGEC